MANWLSVEAESEQESAADPLITPADFAARHERWNYWTVALYLACYRVGIVLVQPDTVLPIFLLQLTQDRVLLGMASSLYLLFWTVPQSLTAFYTTRLREQKSLVSLLMVLHALPWAVLAFYLIYVSTSKSTAPSTNVTIALLFVAIITFSVLGGASIPGYMNMVGKTLVASTRIKLMGYVWAMSAVLTFGASWLMSKIIEVVSFPLNFAIIFLLAFAVFSMAITFWAETKEPLQPVVSPQHSSLGEYYNALFSLLGSDRIFRRFVLSIMLTGFAFPLIIPFVAIHAIDELGFPPSAVGWFLSIQILFQSIAGGVTGRFLPRHSALLGLFWSLCFMALLGATLTVAHAAWVIWVAYAIAGLAQGFFAANYQSVMFEVASDQDASITIGHTNLLRGPCYALGPLFGGLLSERYGFQAAVGVSLLFAVLAMWALWPVLVASKRRTA